MSLEATVALCIVSAFLSSIGTFIAHRVLDFSRLKDAQAATKAELVVSQRMIASLEASNAAIEKDKAIMENRLAKYEDQRIVIAKGALNNKLPNLILIPWSKLWHSARYAGCTDRGMDS